VARILHNVWQDLWNDEQGQDIAEYAVMLAVILVIVVARSGSSARTPTMCSHKLAAPSSKIWSASERDNPCNAPPGASLAL